LSSTLNIRASSLAVTLRRKRQHILPRLYRLRCAPHIPPLARCTSVEYFRSLRFHYGKRRNILAKDFIARENGYSKDRQCEPTSYLCAMSTSGQWSCALLHSAANIPSNTSNAPRSFVADALASGWDMRSRNAKSRRLSLPTNLIATTTIAPCLFRVWTANET
jgi:hypothetical protein